MSDRIKNWMFKQLALKNLVLKRMDVVMHGGQYVTLKCSDAEESLNQMRFVKRQNEISSKQTFVHIISNSLEV